MSLCMQSTPNAKVVLTFSSGPVIETPNTQVWNVTVLSVSEEEKMTNTKV